MLIPFGFLASAGVAAGSYELISTTLLSTFTTSVTFTNAGAWAGYKHLQIRYTARTNRSNYTDFVAMQFNADGGANYAWHALIGNGGSVQSSSAVDQPQITLGNVAGSTSTANVFGAGVIDLLDFAGTKNKTIRTLSGQIGTEYYVQLRSGLWRSTASLTSMTFFSPFDSQFLNGSRFSIYGIKKE